MKFLFFLLFCFSLFAEEESSIVKRVGGHIWIEDFSTACQEARLGIQKYPKSKEVVRAYIKAYAAAGHEKEMLKCWNYYATTFENPYQDRELVEQMGWSIIDKGSKSPSPLVRIIAVLGACYGQDAKGVKIIQRSLRDYDATVRDVSLQIGASFRDERLKREIKALFSSEQIWQVKLSAVKALGRMRIKESLPDLIKLIETPSVSYEMRMAAIQSIAEIEEDATRDQIRKLTESDKIGFRQLACQMVISFEKTEDIDLLLPLLKDSSPEIRALAIYSIGLLRPVDIKNQATIDLLKPFLEDSNEMVAIITAWAAIQYDPPLGQSYFLKWLNNPSKSTRIFAAAALKSSGKYAHPLLNDAFTCSNDPYVRVNLALGLVSEKINLLEASKVIKEFTTNNSERLMWKETLHFKALAPSNIRHQAGVPHLPEATDQLVRLDVINLLAIVQTPGMQDLMEKFLSERNWGVTAVASSLLLTEGNEDAINLITSLLDSSSAKTRMQAALILSMWGEGEKAIDTLIEAYPEVDRSMKERILEAFGQIRCEKTLPFLCDKLSEGHPTLRIIAAAALLKSLYN